MRQNNERLDMIEVVFGDVMEVHGQQQEHVHVLQMNIMNQMCDVCRIMPKTDHAYHIQVHTEHNQLQIQYQHVQYEYIQTQQIHIINENDHVWEYNDERQYHVVQTKMRDVETE